MALNESNKDSKSKLYLFLMILALLLINIGLIYKLMSTDDKLEIANTELENTSAELDELQGLQEDLEAELTSYKGKNASLDSVIQVRDAQIQKKVRELKNRLNAGNLTKAELDKARNEISGLRTQIADLTIEIEELSKENQFLKDEKYVLEKQMEVEKEKVAAKVKENEELTEKVGVGSQLFLKDLDAVPYRKAVIGDYKVTEKLKNVEKIDVTYTLATNNLAEKGSRTLYFQLVSPNKSTIHSSEVGSGKFNYDGGDRFYTVKKEVNFQNKNEIGSFTIPKTEGMTEGTYKLIVYSESHIMETTTFTLR